MQLKQKQEKERAQNLKKKKKTHIIEAIKKEREYLED